METPKHGKMHTKPHSSSYFLILFGKKYRKNGWKMMCPPPLIQCFFSCFIKMINAIFAYNPLHPLFKRGLFNPCNMCNQFLGHLFCRGNSAGFPRILASGTSSDHTAWGWKAARTCKTLRFQEVNAEINYIHLQ